MRTCHPAVGDARWREALSGTRPRREVIRKTTNPIIPRTPLFGKGFPALFRLAVPIFNKAYVNGLVTSWS